MRQPKNVRCIDADLLCVDVPKRAYNCRLQQHTTAQHVYGNTRDTHALQSPHPTPTASG